MIRLWAITFLCALLTNSAWAEQRLSREFFRCEKESRNETDASWAWKACVSDEIDRVSATMSKHYAALLYGYYNTPKQKKLIQSFRKEWKTFRTQYCDDQPFYSGADSAYPAITCELRVLLMEWAEMREIFTLPADLRSKQSRSDLQTILDLGRIP